MSGAPMLHDAAAENRRIRDNRYPGCTCPPWRYHPAHPKPTNPACPRHGSEHHDDQL